MIATTPPRLVLPLMTPPAFAVVVAEEFEADTSPIMVRKTVSARTTQTLKRAILYGDAACVGMDKKQSACAKSWSKIMK